MVLALFGHYFQGLSRAADLLEPLNSRVSSPAVARDARELVDLADDPEMDPRDQNSRETLKRSRDVCPWRSVACAEMTHRITGAARDAAPCRRAPSAPAGCDWAEGSEAADGARGLVGVQRQTC